MLEKRASFVYRQMSADHNRPAPVKPQPRPVLHRVEPRPYVRMRRAQRLVELVAEREVEREAGR
ncbi:hypothetical protein [Candidatus Nephthysia bennettiae]|uniref:Uncharacterized protein n=1 Tax=Candidatus Nephthysia bennettiae TaxID=3127016 RepID=A0A934KAX1_9BACT|nr:hypothetical protein [Candidatus Dormibacteraeota bacterium]